MRILLIEHKEVWAGGQIFLLNLAAGLQTLGCEIRVVCPPAAPLVPHFTAAGIIPTVMPLGRIQKSNNLFVLLQNLWWRILPTWRLIKFVRRFSPEVVVCNDAYSLLAALPMLQLIRLPFLWVVHNTSLPSGRISAFLIRRSPAIAVVAEDIRRQFIKLVPTAEKRISCIYNAVASDRLATLPAGEPITSNSKRFLFLGRLDREKGVDIFLNALHRLQEQRDDFAAIIAGDGPWREELQQLCRNYGLQTRVRFLGFMERPETLWQEADVLVMPSRAVEANSLSILEALCAGVPVVATAIGAVKELSNNYVINLVPAENADALAMSLQEVCEKIDSLKLRARSLVDKARDEFSVERMARDYFTLLQQTIEKSHHDM